MTDTSSKPETAGTIFDIDLGDIDFDIDDFDLSGIGVMPDERTRIIRPPLDTEILTQTVHFTHAEQFAREVDLSKNARTFAWVSGSFIFGDLPEALWRERKAGIKNLYISSLSVSEENIDPWAGMMQTGMIEHFDLLLSAYFYSHEKYSIVPMIYERLDMDNRFQVAFGPYHCKIICVETYKGNTITIHGSANTRSSSNVEQIMMEMNNQPLFEFNRQQISALCKKYGTINHKARPQTRAEMKAWFEKLRKESSK